MKTVSLLLVVLACCSFAVDANRIRFLSLGDWGTFHQGESKSLPKVADAMGKIGDSAKINFTVTTGDNFYDDGVANVDDPIWDIDYEMLFVAKSMQKPWYVAQGNHDHNGNAKALIDYSKKSNRWFHPYYYYALERVVDEEQNSTLKLIVIDTDRLLGGDEDQWRWLHSELESTKASWLVVIGHHPVLSGGENGDTPLLRKRLQPMLQDARADIYLCGHDHTLQHLNDGGVDYFVSGSGGKKGSMTDQHKPLFWIIENGFMHHEVTAGSLTTTIYDKKANELYTVSRKQARAANQTYPVNFITSSGSSSNVLVGVIAGVAGGVVLFGGIAIAWVYHSRRRTGYEAVRAV
eukprot:Colp12_sorted_trinity150504_noHs@12052